MTRIRPALFFIAVGCCVAARKVPIVFEESNGFTARGPSAAFYFTDRQITIVPAHGDAIRLVLEGANADAHARGLERLPGTSNYFVGPASTWRTNIATYRRLEYHGVYPGVDLVFHGSDEGMEYDFVLAPGADLSRVRFSFEGASSLRLELSGDLTIRSRRSSLTQHPPRVYQKREGREVLVEAKYEQHPDGVLGFRLGDYDPALALVIDPVLVNQKTVGGSRTDTPAGIALDGQGNAYVVGTTNSLNFPRMNYLDNPIGGATLMASSDYGQTYFLPSIDAPVLAIAASPVQPSLVYAGTTNGPYVSRDGGRNWSAANAGFVGKTTNAVLADGQIAGRVYAMVEGAIYRSEDAGVTWQGVQKSNGAFSYGALVSAGGPPQTLYALIGTTSLYRSNDGTTWVPLSLPLPRNTYSVLALSTDPINPGVVYAGVRNFSGNAIVGQVFRSADRGNTWTVSTSVNLLSSPTAIVVDPTLPSRLFAVTSDGVARSLDSGATWQTVGMQGLTLDTLAFDPAHPGTLYVVADEGLYTTSDYGVSFHALPTKARHDLRSVFFVKTNPPLLLVGGDPGDDVFIVKWNAAGDTILYSTYLGGSYYDAASGIAVDAAGNAYVAGTTRSTDFPVTSGAAQTRFKGERNGFVTKISPDGNRLLYSTLLGGTGANDLNAIAIDLAGAAYVTGYTSTADFPVTPGALTTTLSAGCASDNLNLNLFDGIVFPSSTSGDAFVSKISPDGSGLSYSTYLGGSCGDAGFGITTDTNGSAYIVGSTYSVDFPVTLDGLSYPQTTAPGLSSGFLVKLNAQGSNILYGTLVGGPIGASARAVTLDGTGHVYVTGSALAPDPRAVRCGVLIAANDGFLGFESGGVYVLKLALGDPQPIYVKSFAECATSGLSVGVDAASHVWIAGTQSAAASVLSSNFSKSTDSATTPPSSSSPPSSIPLVAPFQAFGQGFVIEIGPDGKTIPFSTRIDGPAYLALNTNGNVYVAAGDYGGSIHKEAYSQPSTQLVRIDPAKEYAAVIQPPRGTLGTDLMGVISVGELVDIPGDGIGPATAVKAGPGATGTKNLSGVSVTFGGFLASLVSVQENSVRCIVPTGISGMARAAVQVQYGDAKSNSILLLVAYTGILIPY